MQIRSCAAWAVLLSSAILAGCATSRSEVKIGAPEAVASAPVTQSRAVVIRSVRDARNFQDNPSDPSTPSLGFGGATQAPEAIKARAIGRKRNTYGQALGDVLLEDGQNVTGVVRDNVAAAFRQAGYRIAPDLASAGATPLLVDVDVKKFWAWITPGFWSISLAAQVETDVTISDGGRRSTISVRTEDSRQMVPEGAWVEIVQKALAQYRAEAAKRFMGPGAL